MPPLCVLNVVWLGLTHTLWPWTTQSAGRLHVKKLKDDPSSQIVVLCAHTELVLRMVRLSSTTPTRFKGSLLARFSKTRAELKPLISRGRTEPSTAAL